MGSAALFAIQAPLCVASTLGALKRPAADGCAEDAACPVSAFSAVQATALGATWACDPIFAFGTASTGRLCRQVRIPRAIEPHEARQPARLESRNLSPTALSCHTRGHGELTGGSSVHVSVDFTPNCWSRNGVGTAQNLATTLLTPISRPVQGGVPGRPVVFKKGRVLN